MTTIGFMDPLSFTVRKEAFDDTIEVDSLWTNQAETKIRFCNSRFITVIRTALCEE
jgi:hypothetical protein